MSIPSFVHTATRSSEYELPCALNAVFNAVHYMHRTWRAYRYTKIYTNTDNYLALIAGHGLNNLYGKNGFLGESKFLLVVAQTVQIAFCIIECLEQKVKVYEVYLDWKNSLMGDYYPSHGLKWKRSFEVPAESACWHLVMSRYNRCKKIARCTSELFLQMSILSFKILDTIEACSFDLSTQNESISHLFVHGKHCVKHLRENRDELIDALNNQKEFIQKLFVTAKCNYTAEEMVRAVKQSYVPGKIMGSIGDGIVSLVGKIDPNKKNISPS